MNKQGIKSSGNKEEKSQNGCLGSWVVPPFVVILILLRTTVGASHLALGTGHLALV
jgi:hypothetical protein